MLIEKQNQSLLEPEKLNSKENKTQTDRIKSWVSLHRLNSRQKLNLSYVTFSTFLTFAPFALGFSHFLAHSMSSSKNESFFQLNLPLFKTFQPKINSETIEYVAKPNSLSQLSFSDFQKKLFEAEFNSFLLPNNKFLFGQSKFLAKIKKLPNKVLGTKQDISETKKFSGLSCDFYIVPSGNFLSKTSSVERLARKLDDLPSYLKGLDKTSLFCEPLSFYPSNKNSLTQSNFLSPSKSNKNQILEQQNLLTGSSPFKEKIFLVKENQSKVHKIPRDFSQVNEKSNEFYKNRFDFYKKVDQLNAELQQLFLEKNFSSFSSDIVETESIGLEFFKEESVSEKLLNDLEKKNISKGLLGFRNMSGFAYPDMNANDLHWFYTLRKNESLNPFHKKENCGSSISPKKIVFESEMPSSKYYFSPKRCYPPKQRFGGRDGEQTFLKKKFKKANCLLWSTKKPRVKLETSSFTLLSQNYPFTIKNFPKFLIETRNVRLLNLEQNQVIYNGPSLILDSQTNLDWKIKKAHQENLRSWFHDYLSPSNPLLQIRENFFGNYYSPQFLLDTKLTNFSDFTTNSFLRLKLSKDSRTKWTTFDWVYESDPIQSFFAPVVSSVHIPYYQSNRNPLLNEENLRGISLTLPKIEGEHFFPLIQLKQPIFENSQEFFEGYTPLNEFGVKGNPDSTVSPAFLSQKSFVTKYGSGRYKKISSIFLQNDSKNVFFRNRATSIFVDNWEPLTSTSWLVVSQLSFAIFSFQILKSLADNYGRELLGYLLDLVAALGILDDSLKQQIELLTGQRNKGFRVVLKSRKKFSDIVGIQKLLLEIYEVVLFLRNSARDFSLSQTLPHGILLTGPPGTGKTLLVQALAGEAQVPVIVLSGSSLIEPGESSSFKLQMVFQEARNLAPCIVFIDEIDTLSAKRSQIVQNPMATDEGFESFLESLILESNISFKKTINKKRLELLESSRENKDSKKQEKNPSYSNSDQKEKQLSLLSQLLIELDGIQGRDGVVVIGATNRPEVLDPALLRPGRFDKIIQVSLPEHQKRVEILQFYGQNIGYQKDIPWNYLGERTAGFTAADLATLMNESTIKAILNQSSHTIETIEHGIDRLTTSESEKYTVLKTNKNSNITEKSNTLTISSKMAILRLAYYQAGKIVLSYFLETHPKSVIASLWPRRPTIRSIQITTNLQNSLFEFARLCEIIDRLVGCYAGKAAEFLFLQKFSAKDISQTSTLGLEDLVFAQKLVYFILEDCRFYSKQSHSQEIITLSPNMNMREFGENPEKVDLYNDLIERIQTPPMWEAIQAQTSSLRSKKEKENDVIDIDEQVHYSVPWWQQEISDELEFKPKNPGNGSRLYLYNYERTQRNPEWLPPDEFYHDASGLKNVKVAFANVERVKRKKHSKGSAPGEGTPLQTGSSEGGTQFPPKNEIFGRNIYFPWNDVSQTTRDYPAHSLVLQSFNKALAILNENRELLDRLVVELLYREVLRKPDIEIFVKELKGTETSTYKKQCFLEGVNQTQNQPLFEKEKLVEFVEIPWGPKSRKPFPRWIDFAGFREETT